MTITVHKLNESYSVIDSDQQTLMTMFEYLKVERPGAYFDNLVKAGFKSPYEYFGSIQQNKLLVMNGHLQLLKCFGLELEEEIPEFDINDINNFLTETKKILPFEPYDFQEKAFVDSLLNKKQINRMCTSSGKSLTISLIAEFFRQRGKKGLLLVPNINLLTQFKNDIKDYNLVDLYDDTHTIGGGNSERHFNNSLTISTWQSLQDLSMVNLNEIDYVICDECHRFAAEVSGAIVKSSSNCKYKWGFTGTLPEDPVMKMQLLGLFGLPKTFITARQLIDRGLATPIKINSIMFNYNQVDKNLFKEIGSSNYLKQLGFIKDHEKRTQFIVNLACKLKGKGNSLVLGQHVSHLKTMYLGIMEKLYPDVKNIGNKQITGKGSFEFQEQYGVYYISGSDDAKTREMTRKILEEDLFAITLEDDTVIRLHGNKEVLLINGTKKLVKDLTEDDEIDDNFIHKDT